VFLAKKRTGKHHFFSKPALFVFFQLDHGDFAALLLANKPSKQQQQRFPSKETIYV